MDTLSEEFCRKVEVAFDQSFTMEDFYKGAVSFRNQQVKYDDFTLFYEKLTEEQILKIVEILVAVYADYPSGMQKVEFNYSPTQRSLNSSTDFSAKFVSTVLDEEKDPLHKLLLLTSGKKFLKSSNVDLMCELARVKNEWDEDYSVVFKNNSLYLDLKDHYILPGVTRATLMPGGQDLSIKSFENISIESSVRLLAFLSNCLDTVTLEEHFALEFSEAITTSDALPDFGSFNSISAVMLSENYSDIPKTMTAFELDALSKILIKGNKVYDFPKEIIVNRCEAMANKKSLTERIGPSSILKYMSDDEIESLSSREFAKNVDSMLSERLSIRASRPPVVYAALAEVLSVKGEKQALDVALVLRHVHSKRESTPDFYEAVVGLIAEILKPENDGLPFAWIAQMSEHSWVMNSMDSNKEAVSLLR
jgi:hypothetical protein